MAIDPGTLILVATTLGGMAWAYIERRAKNVSREEKGQLEDQILDAVDGGLTPDEAFDVFKNLVKYSRD